MFNCEDIYFLLDPKEGKEPEISICLEIADEMDKEKEQTKEICESILENLKSSDVKRRLKTIYFLEILVKNCKMRFHYFLFSKKFCKTLLKILAKRRGKNNFLNSLISKKKEYQKEIEDRILFLIQLWFDTFMLHEDEFKNIVEVYKTLRKESIIFPMRDAKSQFFINFDGKKSPIFEAIEEGYIYEEPGKVFSKKKYQIDELKITDQTEEIEYKYPPRNNRNEVNEIESVFVKKEEISNLLEMMPGILENPKKFVKDDNELAKIIFDSIKKNCEKLKKNLEKKNEEDEDYLFFKESYFKLKKMLRTFEEALDEVNFEDKKETDLLNDNDSNDQNIKKQNDEDILNLIDFEPNNNTNIVQNKKQEIDFLDLNVKNEENFKFEETENKKVEIKFESKLNNMKKNENTIVQGDAFDFLTDLGELKS